MTPPWGQNLRQKMGLHTHFCLHTHRDGSGFRYFRFFLRYLHLLTEIYPLVPHPTLINERGLRLHVVPPPGGHRQPEPTPTHAPTKYY